jgi:hypothetical protein
MSLSLLGKPFSTIAQNDVSDARLDAKTFMIDTSLNIFNFPKIPGQPFIPRDTGNGFVKNQPCFLSVDGDVIIPFGLKKHTHSHDTDIDGGLQIETFLANIGNLDIYLGNTYNINNWIPQVSGAGAAVTEGATNTMVELTTGTALNGYANVNRKGNPIDFSKKSAFVARFEYEDTIANYLFREGINAERVDLANDPTQRSYGIEGCSAQSNYQCWSSDGTARSTTSTIYAVDSVDNTWMAQHNPASPNIIYTKNVDFGANQVTKTSDIPVSGIGATANYFSAGIKSTLISQAKRIFQRGVVVMANIGSTEWKWYAT